MFAKIFLLLLITGYQYAFVQGKSYIDFVSFTHLEGDPDIFNMEIVPSDGQKILKLTVNLPWDMDESVEYDLNMDHIKNGKRTKGFFQKKGKDACAALSQFVGRAWTNACDAMGMEPGCPKYKGSYSVESFEFNPDDVEIPAFAYGRYCLKIALIKDDIKYTEFEIELTNDPPGYSS